LFHGLFLILERRGLGTWLERSPVAIRHMYLLLVVMSGWVLFRADSLSYAGAYFQALAGFGAVNDHTWHVGLWLDSGLVIALGAGLIGATPWMNAAGVALRGRLARPGTWPGLVSGTLALGRAAGLAFVLLASAATMLAGTYNPFIYFRF
jgi:alginate O-acetyltransferase complex protein AlgI